MRRTIRTLSILPIALCALLFLAPSRALAANYASPDEVFVNGTALSDNTPSGVSYNAASGTLTLNNFNGKTIFVQDSGTQPCDLVIVLLGNNTLTYDGSDNNPYNSGSALFNSFGGSHLTITSPTGTKGSLTINRTYASGETFLQGIYSGDVSITGDARIAINIRSTSNVEVQVTGVRCMSGGMDIRDNASLAITADVKKASACRGMAFGYAPGNYLLVRNSTSFNIDLSKVNGCITYGITATSRNSGDCLALQYLSTATFKTTYVAHNDSTNYVSGDHGNPDVSNYYRTDVQGTHTYIRRQAWSRLAGDTRYGTMAMISQVGFSPKYGYAVVATGENFPDALVASALAGVYDCPVLLTAKNSLSPEAADELVRLNVSNVYVMGGPGAVSDNVIDQIYDLGITNVKRVEGPDRIGTSLDTLMTMKNWGAYFDTIVICTGKNYADALSIGPFCYHELAPILLVGDSKRFNNEQIAAIKSCTSVKYIVFVGGEAVVDNEAIMKQLGSSYSYALLAGSDRYGTSLDVANWEHIVMGMTGTSVVVATGANFPDALAGAALAGNNSSVMLLVGPGASGRNAVTNYLVDHNHASILVDDGFILGGTYAVPQETADYLASFTAAG